MLAGPPLPQLGPWVLQRVSPPAPHPSPRGPVMHLPCARRQLLSLTAPSRSQRRGHSRAGTRRPLHVRFSPQCSSLTTSQGSPEGPFVVDSPSSGPGEIVMSHDHHRDAVFRRSRLRPPLVRRVTAPSRAPFRSRRDTRRLAESSRGACRCSSRCAERAQGRCRRGVCVVWEAET